MDESGRVTSINREMGGSDTSINPESRDRVTCFNRIVEDRTTSVNSELVDRTTAINQELEDRITSINREMGGAATSINPESDGRATSINAELAGQATSVNPEFDVMEDGFSEGAEIKVGTFVGDGYMIIRKMNQNSGEANLYLAEKSGRLYVMKHYRRENAVKPEITKILLETNHPNLPKLYDAGVYQNRQYEVMEFYPEGSLQGKRLDEEELRKVFVPDMNEAVHQLDMLGIVHKDIKPANIAKKADGHYVLMDFGISSIRRDGRTRVSTQIGQTMDYSAPESVGAGATWSVLSDYYALGISIYELLLGRLPYDGMSDDEKIEYRNLNRFPFPDSVSSDFQKLILGMTYKDITNRHDLSNVNNRWGYEFICDWLNGKEMTVPGANVTVRPTITLSEWKEPFEFEGIICGGVDELMAAMAKNPVTALQYMRRGWIGDHFKTQGQNKFANEWANAESGGIADFIKLVYGQSHEVEHICWVQKGETKNSDVSITMYPEELGRDMLKNLWACNGIYDKTNEAKFGMIREMAKQQLFSLFYTSKAKGSRKEEVTSKCLESLLEIENVLTNTSEQAFYTALYELAYVLTEMPVLYINGKTYQSKREFVEEFENRLAEEYVKDFEKYLSTYIVDYGQPTQRYELQVAAWLKHAN